MNHNKNLSILMALAILSSQLIPAGIVLATGSDVEIDSVKLNGVSIATVAPSATVLLSVTVERDSGSGSNNDWKSTSYRIESGSYICVNTADKTSDGGGTDTLSFNITAPASAGTYDVDVKVFKNDSCSSEQDSKDGNNNLIVSNPTATIVATKIVCDSESDLPNWGLGGSNIIASTASNFLSTHPNCHPESGWDFQWGPSTATDAGGSFIGAAPSPWTTFGSTNGSGIISMIINLTGIGDRIWVREILKSGYLSFSNSTNNVSAEMYCYEDVLNYDNYDYILNPVSGGTYHCVAFNTLAKAKVLVIKNVLNDNGGQLSPSDFTINVLGNNPSQTTFSGSSSGVWVTFDPGSYSIDEVRATGYAKTRSPECFGILVAGEVKTCTILNDDMSPKLTVTKVVVNDEGGTKVIADFPLFVGSNPVVSTNLGLFNPGTYIVSESNSTGYSADFSGDCDPSGNITLVLGDIKTCTITNNDNPVPPPPTEDTLQLCSDTQDNDTDHLIDLADPDCAPFIPKLTVIKQVTNDNGGQLLSSDFTMTVSATNPSESSFAGSATGVVITLDPGSYSVDENAGAGYQKTLGSDCSGSIAIGEVKSCTVTNDDIGALLTLIKNVVGGTKVVSDFILSIIDTNQISTQVLSGVASTLSAGQYQASEVNDPDYAASDWSGACAPNGSVTLTLGDNVTCEITNTFIPPVVITPPSINPPDPEDEETDTTTTTTTTNTGGGGGGGTVLGLITIPAPVAAPSGGEILGTSCEPYLKTYIRLGARNDAEEVKKLQIFLNRELGLNLPISGFYGVITRNAVNQFQVKYSGEVLVPWLPHGLPSGETPTGYVYKTTQRWINMVNCPALNLQVPRLP